MFTEGKRESREVEKEGKQTRKERRKEGNVDVRNVQTCRECLEVYLSQTDNIFWGARSQILCGIAGLQLLLCSGN